MRAFHGQRGVICPYTTHEMLMASNTEKIIYQNFNHYHSGERMCSEHGALYMKSWGVVRGRNDITLFDNQELYYTSVKVCWALHNYVQILQFERNNS